MSSSRARTTTGCSRLLLPLILVGLALPLVAQESDQSLNAIIEAAKQAADKAAQQPAEPVAPEQQTTPAGDLVNRDGDVHVAKDQTVEGNVIVVNGAARVHGKVKGRVIAVKGPIYLPKGSSVGGDVIAFGGQITREPGAEVGGAVVKRPASEASEVEAAAKAALAEPPEPAEPGPPSPPQQPEAPSAQPSTISEVVRFGQPVEVKADETVAGSVVSLGGPVTVDGAVKGDVVSIGGPVDIEGRVSGDAVSVGGPLHLLSSAVIHGDAVAVGAPLREDTGATVHGRRVSAGGPGGGFPWNVLPGLIGLHGAHGHVGRPAILPGLPMHLGDWVPRTLALLLMAALVVLVAPRQTQVVASSIEQYPGRAPAYGLVGWLLVLPVLFILILLVVTWLLIPLYLLAMGALLILGYVGVALHIGRWVSATLNWRLRSLFTVTVLGIAALAVVDLFSPVPILGMASGLVMAAAMVFALGATLMTRFGTDPRAVWLAGRLAVAAGANGDDVAPPAAGTDPPEERVGDEPFDCDEATRQALGKLPGDGVEPEPSGAHEAGGRQPGPPEA